MSVFGNNCRYFRKKIKMTQEEVSKKVGISQPSYALMESGKRDPDTDTVIKIATVLNVTPNDLFDFETRNFYTIPNRIRERLSHLTDEQIYDILDKIALDKEEAKTIDKEEINTFILPKLNCNVGENDFGSVYTDGKNIENFIKKSKLKVKENPNLVINYSNDNNLLLYFTTRNTLLYSFCESSIDFSYFDNETTLKKFIVVFIVKSESESGMDTFFYRNNKLERTDELKLTLLTAKDYMDLI